MKLTSFFSALILVGLDSDFIEELQLDKSIEAAKTEIGMIVFIGDFFIFLK
ncbi:hypothetical protein EV03_1511 [Prochlorococcus marinus str. PAC1]|uniref:Uncharacterized protein n=1 Tax=Prochlorococcus marinus str. PAC1 TaxID=59924 RepID=A0A0A2C3I9_PROMR|nr:hypothetical protein EV03_1511 [Prochlorococcus marinus str. PAC1]